MVKYKVFKATPGAKLTLGILDLVFLKFSSFSLLVKSNAP
nr:MAG TPA: hypothetical protein [Caudoviricetes sp.]